jgi:hypothetical protein
MTSPLLIISYLNEIWGLFALPGIELRALSMVGKYSATKVHLQFMKYLLYMTTGNTCG